MSPYLLPSIGAAAATTLSLLALSVMQVSVVCFTLAAIPLIYFALGAPLSALALSISFTCLMLLSISATLCLFFIAAIGVPSLFFMAHIRRGNAIGAFLSDLALYATLLLASIQWMLWDMGGIAAVTNQAFDLHDMSAIDPELAKQISWLSGKGSFLLVSAASWWSMLIFYASSWIACWLKDSRYQTHFSHQVRPAPFYPSFELFCLLILCSTISLLPNETLAFIGTAGFVIILLPYALSGAMYTPLRKWRGMQTGWMFLVIFLCMIFAWPAAILCMVGVWKHAEALLSRKN